jgi:hypothetical protein
MIRLTNFGNSKAALALADIIIKKNNIYLSRKVSAFTQYFYTVMYQLQFVKNLSIRCTLMKMFMEERKEYLSNDYLLDQEVVDFLQGVIRTNYRTWLRKVNSLQKEEKNIRKHGKK